MISSGSSLRSSGSGASRAAFGGRAPPTERRQRHAQSAPARWRAPGPARRRRRRIEDARRARRVGVLCRERPREGGAERGEHAANRAQRARIAEPLPPAQRFEPIARRRRQPGVRLARGDPRVQECKKVGVAFADRESRGAREQRPPRRDVDDAGVLERQERRHGLVLDVAVHFAGEQRFARGLDRRNTCTRARGHKRRASCAPTEPSTAAIV